MCQQRTTPSDNAPFYYEECARVGSSSTTKDPLCEDPTSARMPCGMLAPENVEASGSRKASALTPSRRSQPNEKCIMPSAVSSWPLDPFSHMEQCHRWPLDPMFSLGEEGSEGDESTTLQPTKYNPNLSHRYSQADGLLCYPLPLSEVLIRANDGLLYLRCECQRTELGSCYACLRSGPFSASMPPTT